MTLDEAIKHCEEEAESEEKDLKKWEYSLKVYKNRNDWDHSDAIKQCELNAKRCKACAAEHRQLAAWLKELRDRRAADADK